MVLNPFDLSDHARVERHLAEHGRVHAIDVTSAGSRIVDTGPRARFAKAIVFTFDPAGTLIKVNRPFMAWWLLRGSGVKVPHAR